ncbi:hypothetical protein PIROE2DRAFT_50789 [Piromyces sp. E2]|nr:hypothetical protein PIROE2DRAFT_50789 [Piromyces sp. E2]|eukprot:OUM66753.1 hypothetical protein PIROE2DRAFT_50789 [Piromyces sp. E2]
MAENNIIKIPILGKESIVVGNNLTAYIAKDVVSSVKASTYCIITDENVAMYHLENLENLLTKEANTLGRRVLSYTIPAGELQKCRDTKAEIEDYLLSNKCTRDTCILALGGGVIGDLSGYVAATFMRGCPVIQIPTTLLAMVDSSIGGKTAIDVPGGKNIIGAFHQPTRIFIDPQYLRTLPLRQFRNGMGEVIKTAAFWSSEDFSLLENNVEKILAFARNESQDAADIVQKIIQGAANTKAYVVTHDEKEGGLRGVLNFGHTIGHAIEAILAPAMYHGECVSMGMVYEAEIARSMGLLKDAAVGRLARCIQAYGLPASINDPLVDKNTHGKQKEVTVERLMEIMKLDKKNRGTQKRIVIISEIGKLYEEKPTNVDDEVIVNALSPALKVTPVPESQKEEISMNVPGSKSISNRALILASLAQGKCKLKGLLLSDDTQVMLDALQYLGIKYFWEDNGDSLVIEGSNGQLQVPSSEIYLGNAGTASRFLTSVCTLISEAGPNTVLTGNARMKERPIGPLVEALNANGCDIKFLGKNKSLPISIAHKGTKLQGGKIQLAASVSSQYVSSILMSAPYAQNPVTLELVGDNVVSQPYIDMTIAMMKHFGIEVTREPNSNIYHIPAASYTNPETYIIEADATSATYPLAYAAITGSKVTVENIGNESLQGDSEFATKVLQSMGCTVSQTAHTTTVQGPARGQLKSIKIDMETMTDAFLTATVLAAVANGETEITGISNQRVKECNRIEAMITELAKFGVNASELEDGIKITGVPISSLKAPVDGVKCYDDHRIAMSFSILSLVVPSQVLIKEKRCVEKTWPSWWDTLHNVLKVKFDGYDTLPDEMKQLAKEEPKQFNDASLIIIGMRGAGKTYMGKIAAKILGRKFVDMDWYFEQELNTTIKEYIPTKGWEQFRIEEVKLLKKIIAENPTGLVISCGGGIVETEDGRNVLKQYASQGIVLHFTREIEDIVSYLSKDETRPSFADDITTVWERRKDWFQECSTHEFYVYKGDNAEGKGYWNEVESDYKRFIEFICANPSSDETKFPGNVYIPPASSYFLSLTYSDIKEAIPILEKASEGSDALELRVDLLASQDVNFVRQQLFILRRYTKLPIIFTVRTDGQGGRFPPSEVDRMFELLEYGLKWGCEYVDVEVDVIGKGKEHRIELTSNLVNRKGNSKIIASYHDCSGTALWDPHTIASINTDTSKIVNGPKRLLRMRDKYMELLPYGDIIKLIGYAHKLQDNFTLYTFVKEIVPSLGLQYKPVIAMNMGPLGQISRALNEFFSPVTHPILPFKAAPGQLSIQEINKIRSSIGLIAPKKYYLFGSPIAYSQSPTIHNTGFEVLGLPHKYELSESEEWTHVKKVVEDGIKDGSFGGASVTIPHKQNVIEHGIVQRVTDAAKAIGAVNTLMVEKDEEGNPIVAGDNTDYLGIKRCIENRISKVRNSYDKFIGVVVGAGGTARAACYSLTQLGVDKLLIWNRTTSKAEELAKIFGGEVVQNLGDCLKTESDPKVVYAIVGTVPAAAQVNMNFTEFFDSGKKGVIVEMAYKPRRTPLLNAAAAAKDSHWETTEGVDVLIEQGLEQFIRWTGRIPPSSAIAEQVYSRYSE